MRLPRSGGDDEGYAIRGQPSGVCGCNRVARPRPLASYHARQMQGRSDMRTLYIKDVCLLYANPVCASPSHDMQRGRGASRSTRWATRPATGPGEAWPPWCSQAASLMLCQAVPRGSRARSLYARHHGLDTQETRLLQITVAMAALLAYLMGRVVAGPQSSPTWPHAPFLTERGHRWAAVGYRIHTAAVEHDQRTPRRHALTTQGWMAVRQERLAQPRRTSICAEAFCLLLLQQAHHPRPLLTAVHLLVRYLFG